jgi:hypothetical protein
MQMAQFVNSGEAETIPDAYKLAAEAERGTLQ